VSLDADLLLDRRRLTRRLNFWRVVTVVAVVAALLVVIKPGRGGGGLLPHLVRVNVDGIIAENTKTLEAIAALAKDRSVPAVIVSINSPGGTVSGGETLHAALKRVAAVKPVIAVMHGTAASAGYMIAMPAARVFARESTLTGSIGVILQTGEVSGLLEKLGVSAEAVTSGPLKDQPSMTRPLTPEGRAYLNGLVADMYDQFVTMVAEGRHMDKAKVAALADGRAYTGRQALALGLVDEMGGEAEAREWLAKTHGIADSVPITDLRTSSRYERLMGMVGGTLADLLVRAGLGVRPLPAGAWSVWQGNAG